MPNPAKFDHNAYLAHLTNQPGIYQMLDESGKVLYVGKARNLKNRVRSYFQKRPNFDKTAALVAQIADIRVVITPTEHEALLLENHLIKQLKPRYNILFRDDKTYPFLRISENDKFPGLYFYRGVRKPGQAYFGPYPNVPAVRSSIRLLQSIFQLRTCNNHFFKNRTRPCLQYHIERCRAPCVGNISEEEYAHDVESARLFLQGKNKDVTDYLHERMKAAAENQDFERAAQLRDQLENMKIVISQTEQHISCSHGNADVLAACLWQDKCYIQQLTVRRGQVIGNQFFTQKSGVAYSTADALGQFISHHYLNPALNASDFPKEIIVSEALPESTALAQALSERAEHKISIRHRVIGDRAKWLQLAIENVENTLQQREQKEIAHGLRLAKLSSAWGSEQPIERLACMDISHTQGHATVASCVVFDKNGPCKSAYRRFLVRTTNTGDDYQAMREVLYRYGNRLLEAKEVMPDILIVDGGKGQLAIAEEMRAHFGFTTMGLMAIAKGPARKAGAETIWRPEDTEPLSLPEPAQLLIQHIRDEAHRFAITTHRKKRNKEALL